MGLEFLDPFGIGTGFIVLAVVVLIALAILFLLPTIQARKAGRSGWWIYLICFFVSPLNLAALIAWFAYFKDHPTKLGDSGLVV